MAGDALPPGRAALLHSIERLQPRRVLVMGEDALDILCTLIRFGCGAASEVLAADWLEPHSTDLLAGVLPRPDARVRHLLIQARRALVPGGKLVLQVSGAAREARAQHCTLLSGRAGFGDMRVQLGPDATILIAQLAAS